MPIYEYECPLCHATAEGDISTPEGIPCPQATCEGYVRRRYSLYVKPVAGGGGSPGRRIG